MGALVVGAPLCAYAAGVSDGMRYGGCGALVMRHDMFTSHTCPLCGFGHALLSYDRLLLCFVLQVDPGEQWELQENAEYGEVLAQILAESKRVQAEMTFNTPELEKEGLDVQPCCDKASDCFCTNNATQPLLMFGRA